MGVWCFKRNKNLVLCFFSALYCFSPPYIHDLGAWHPAASALQTRAVEDKDRGDVSWQCPGASLMRRAALAWAGCAEQDTGHLLMSLSSRSRLCSIKRLHRIVTWCFNDIYYDSWAKAMFLWSNYSLPEESAYWAYLQLSSDACDKCCSFLSPASSQMGPCYHQSCASAESPESFNRIISLKV